MVSESLSHRHSHSHSQKPDSTHLKPVHSENHHHLPQPHGSAEVVSAHSSSGFRQDAHEFLHQHSSEHLRVASQGISERHHRHVDEDSHEHSPKGSHKDSDGNPHHHSPQKPCKSFGNPSHKGSHISSHRHSHRNSHGHSHRHSHQDSHRHSHLPPGADGEPVTWRSLVALGVSGGLVPCPAALVLLLSAIALGKTGFGLVLVLAFSLGLAGVLTGLGLLLVRAKHWFRRVPAPQRWTHILPLVSAAGITLLGVGISLKALTQLLL
ncbi:MAG: sulfite exporter TauE/SafE family protein [Thermoleptolyngbya sp. C42_A2020_037]|nr:sulfite exporter TauE/SafE family protein [Thermoleptolyngbya sp. C42_A2020_037]